jgi:hypothetical protein
VAQGVGLEFKPQYHKTNKQKNIVISATWEVEIRRISFGG